MSNIIDVKLSWLDYERIVEIVEIASQIILQIYLNFFVSSCLINSYPGYSFLGALSLFIKSCFLAKKKSIHNI